MVERTLPHSILAQARRTPDAVAIRQWSTELTYGGLISRAASIAEELHQLGIGPESRVGMCAQRHPDSIAALLGVWLAGGAYVPVDLANPGPRGRRLLADAGTDIVIADAAGRARLGISGFRYVDVCPRADHIFDPETVRPHIARAENLAYVLYTSGSSGQPKGVLTTHQNLADWVAGCAKWVNGIGPQMRSLALHSLAFDASCYDLFVPLVHGGSVQFVNEEDRADPSRLQRFMAEHKVTWAAMPPGVAALLEPTGLPSLEAIILGGEVVAPQLVAKWTTGSNCRFYHAYGPTEATVVQVATELHGHWTTTLPLGAALPGQRLYVLDSRGSDVGVGEEGELCIAGTGTARGYLRQPALTAERFVPEPNPSVPGARMYRTGDIVRRLNNGGLLFIGRRDGQAQVRGQRVEVGEVEAVLREHYSVANVAVVTTAVRQNTELVAFLTSVNGTAQPSTDELREFIAARLPAAMVPRHFEWIEQLPVTVSGKIDRKRLAELAADALSGSRRERARDEQPRPYGCAASVASLWQRILGGEAPRLDADFFALGGHSLDAMRLAAAVRSELRRDIEVADILAARTLAALTQRVSSAPVLSTSSPVPGQPPSLSAAQRRLWFLDKLTPGVSEYNIVFAERLRGELNADALRAALSAVAERQSVLRWRILDVQGQPAAVCDPPAPVPMQVVQIADADLSGALTRAADYGFDLANGPLWKAVLFRLAVSGDHVLVLTFHHAIMDGWSQETLYADLSAAYHLACAGAAPRLPDLTFGFADCVAWRAERDRLLGDEHLRWWTQHLREAPRTLQLPRDRHPRSVRSGNGSSISFNLHEQLDHSVRHLAKSLGVTPSMIVLAALAEALHRLTGSNDLIIGAVVADRTLAATHEVAGFFVDMVPLRLRAEQHAIFAAAVQSVSQEVRAASAHPAATLEQIVDALGVPRRAGRWPLVQVVFNAYNFASPQLDLPAIEAEPLPVPMHGAPVELTVYFVERCGRFALDLRYDSDLYDAARMEQLGSGLLDLLGHVVASPHEPVAAAPTRFRTDSVFETPLVRASEPTLFAIATTGETQTERLITGIWREVLGAPDVGASDNFFDIGGDSFLLVQVQARLNEAIGRPVPLIDLFRFPSIRSLAVHLDGGAQESELIGSARLIAARRVSNRGRRHRA